MRFTPFGVYCCTRIIAAEFKANTRKRGFWEAELQVGGGTSSVVFVRRTVAVAAFTLIGCVSAVSAQQIPSRLPSAAEPGRELEAPRLEPSLQGRAITVPEATVIQAPPGAEQFTFHLSRVTIEGATAFSEEDLRASYESLLNRTVSVADLFGAVADIERRYREAGYVTSRAIIPQQTIEDGTFRVLIVEGFISDIVYADEVGPAKPTVEALLAPLRGVAPISIYEIERRLLLADELPGMRIRGTLEASPTQRGGSVLTIKAERRPYDVSAAIDNRGSRYTSRYSLLTTGVLNSFGPNADRVYAIGKVSLPLHREQLVSLGYQANIGSEGLTWNATTTASHSKPGLELEQLDVRSRVLALTTGASYPLIRSRLQNLRIDGQFEYRNVQTDLLQSRFTDDRLRIVAIGASYDRIDSLDGLTALRTSYSRGLDVLNSSEGPSRLSRAEGRSDFDKVVAQATRIQNLPQNFSLLLTASGQMAWVPLLASEEFGIGGGNFGKGYDPGEISGDRGVAASIELRYAPDVPSLLPHGAQFYGYYDIGKVWNLDSRSGTGESLASVGIGVRANLAENLLASLELSKPLTRVSSTESSKTARAFFGVSSKF